MLGFSIELETCSEGSSFLLNAVGVEVIELLDRDVAWRGVERAVRIDVAVVVQDVAIDDTGFSRSRGIRTSRCVIRRRGDVQGNRLRVGRSGGTVRAASAVIGDLNNQGVCSVIFR